MSDPAPAPLDYQTPQTEAHGLSRFCGAIALACAVVQVPWLYLEFALNLKFRTDQTKDFGIDTAFMVFGLLPSLGAAVWGMHAFFRGDVRKTQRVLALFAIVIAGAFSIFRISMWWWDVLHAAPGERWNW